LNFLQNVFLIILTTFTTYLLKFFDLFILFM